MTLDLVMTAKFCFDTNHRFGRKILKGGFYDKTFACKEKQILIVFIHYDNSTICRKNSKYDTNQRFGRKILKGGFFDTRLCLTP